MQEAIALYQKGKMAQAREICVGVLNQQPSHYEALHLLGLIAAQANDYPRSIDLLGKSIKINPGNVKAYLHIGAIYRRMGQFDIAIKSYNKAIAMSPDHAEAYYNLGVAYSALKRYDAAIRSYDRAIAISPDYASACWNKSLLLLLLGDYENGLPLYEWRWKQSDQVGLQQRNFSQPLWLGNDSLTGKIILLHSEQGLGDAIQFCRYARLVAGQGARVILEVPEALTGLLRGLEGVADVVDSGKPLPPFDYHCPFLSLPLAFGTHLANIPVSPAYLRAEESKTQYWGSRLGTKAKPRAGIVWSGGSLHKNDHNRSVALSQLLSFLPDAFDYVSLQKEVRDTDRATLDARPDIRHFGEELNDFTDTAALCGLMDVVISIDTSVAHLAGALGRPTWILLPHVPDWRWLLGRPDSPWYPSVQLYRQGREGDWPSALEQVSVDMMNLSKRMSPD